MIIDSKKYNGMCSCGKEHKMTTELCVIEQGCMKKINKYINECGLSGYSVAIYDDNTYKATQGLHPSVDKEIILSPNHLHADNHGVALTLNEIPQNTSAIMHGAFQDHAKLETINIPEGVEWIGQSTFKNCTSLSHVYIPSTVKGIHSWAFKDCVALREIEFGGTMEQWNLMKENELGRHQGWAEGSKINKVYCSDGVIEITEEDR